MNKVFIVLLLALSSLYSDNSFNTNNTEIDYLSNTDLEYSTTQKRSLGYLLYDKTSTTPLLAGEEYNSGPIDVAEFSMISVVVTGLPTTATGDIYIEFSPDSIHWDRSIIIPVSNLQKEPPHTFIPISVFARIRYINGPIDQIDMRLQAVFHRNTSKGLTSRLEQSINATSDVDNVRASGCWKNTNRRIC